MNRRTGVLFVVCVLSLAPTALAQAVEDVDCFNCHNDPGLHKTLGDGTARSLYVDQEVYTNSVHGSAGCTSCHADIAELPHASELQHVNCGACHGEAEIYANSNHGKALKNGDSDVALCDDCHGKHDIRYASDPLSMVHPRNQPATCGKCHSNRALAQQHMVSVVDPSATYLKSIHAHAILEGRNENAATCSKCHGTHDLLSSMDPNSRVYRMNIPKTCGECHPDILKEFEESIHGQALSAGIKDAPTCIDCHGEHDIEPPEVATSPINLQQVSKATCPRCHDDERIMERYGIVTKRQASYMDSYHGTTGAVAAKVVASCVQCHRVHDIRPVSDPTSSVHPDNLPKTCGQCHENAGPNFAASPVHVIPAATGQKALGMVRLVYIWVIGLTIGFMLLHNTLLLARHALTRLQRERRGPGTYRRFSLGEVIGHMLLGLSFIVLAVSGFALRYPESWWAQWVFFGDQGLEARSTIHRGAGLVLVAITVINTLYIVGTRRGRGELGALMIRWRDIKDLFANLAYAAGLRNDRPQFDRYSYSEKFEYWGLWWGSLLMIVTGFCMWYADLFMRYFSKVWLDIAALIHFFEAILAV
ncbi:MAG: cytochrome b/b6 domain-containing protein, partial [Candidatus Hydrogenedentes bacterium]|nr:cytochrome b/b6 domain-containing protein [Candidatus Hydrogenedentota bacterium]